MNFFEELKRRNVFRVGVAYLVGAWLLAQIAELLLETFNAPEWTMQFLVILLGTGFIVALFFAWAFELTPEGVKRDAGGNHSAAMTAPTSRKLDRAIIVTLVLALAYFVWESRFHNVETGGAVEVSTADQALESRTDHSPASKSVAVLPFLNMSSDPEQEYFSDGITEEIINALVKIEGLSVPARTSVFAFKGASRDVRGIGQELGVAHVLEGSIRSQDKQVRITAQLIKVDDGFHLWSDSYDRELSNIFEVQEEIAAAISEVLIGELDLGGSAVPNQTSNMEAYDLYLQGRDILRNRSIALNRFPLAISLFETAVEIDPEFAPAWAALAVTVQISDYRSDQSDHSQNKTIELAEHALELDPGNVEAMTAIASAMRDTWRWSEAAEFFEKALAIDPESAELLEDYAEFHGMTGSLERYLELAERGFTIDSGLAPLSNAYYSALVANHRSAEALSIIDQELSENPQHRARERIVPLLALGDLEGAIKSYKSMADDDADLAIIALLESPGDPQARDLVHSQLASSNQRSHMGTYLDHILALTVTGDVDFAINHLITVREKTGWGNFEGMWSPLYSPLRQHQRFEEFLELVSLPGYWDQVGWPALCHRSDDGRIACQ